MLKIYISLLLFIFTAMVSAQEPDLLYLNNGKTSAILLSVPPEYDQSAVISRRPAGSGEEYQKLNAENPLMKSDDYGWFLFLMGDDMSTLVDFLDVEDAQAALVKMLGNSVEASIAAILFPGAAQISGRMFIDSTIVSGREYEYKVEYMSYRGKVLSDFTKKVKAVVTVPDPPSSLTSKIKGVVHFLEWSYPKWEENPDNLGVKFNVYRKVGKGSAKKINSEIIIRNDAQPGNFTELLSDSISQAEYYITAVDPLGNESKPSKSLTVNLMSDEVPQSPSSLNSSAAGNKVNLIWERSTDPAVTGFNVLRREGFSGDPVKINKKLVSYQTPFYVDSLVKLKIEYYYFVTTVSKNGKESKLSGVSKIELIDNEKPLPPSGLKVSSIGNFVKLEWKASTSKDVKKYNIFRGETRSIISTINSTTNTFYIDSGYADKKFTPNQYYYYTVSATDEVDLQGSTCDTVIIRYPDREAPPAPAPFEIKMLTASNVQVRAGMNPVKDLAKVNIYRRNVTKNSKEELIAVKNAFPVIYVDTNAAKLNTYIYSVEAIDSSGNKSSRSVSDSIKVVDLFKPAAVPKVNAVARKEGGVSLSWIKVYEEDLAGYHVYRSNLPTGIFERITVDIVKNENYTDSQGRREHFYKVIAVDTSGNESLMSEYAEVIIIPEEEQ